MRQYGTDLVWLVGIVAAGCQELPPPKVNPETVFQAAREVIESRYPQSASSAGNGFVLALTPITTDGGSRTRKQIAVDIRQNYTGNFEPVVAVRTLVEADDPITMSQPGTTQNWRTPPLPWGKWRVLDTLPYEEEAITNDILQKLEPKGI
jgi:hypothetical protein